MERRGSQVALVPGRIADLDAEKAAAAAEEIGNSDVAIGVAADVTDEAAVQAAIDATLLAFGGIDLVVNNAGLSLSKSLLETTEADWDLQHDVMARAPSWCPRRPQGADRPTARRRHHLHLFEELGVRRPNNIAYSATKADQAHQVRLLAAELGEHGVKVNGINPDGVVRGSGIFAGGWGAKRAAVYGVAEEDLGKYYAQRTLLKREVLPENVANAAFALCTSDISHTPACTSRWTPVSPRRSCDEHADGSPRLTSAPPAGASCSATSGRPPRHAPGRPVPQRPGAAAESGARTALLWDVLGLFGHVCDGLSAAARASRASASTPGPSTTGCSTVAGCCRAASLPRRAHGHRGRRSCTVSSTRPTSMPAEWPAVPALQHAVPTRRREGRGPAGVGRHRAADP